MWSYIQFRALEHIIYYEILAYIDDYKENLIVIHSQLKPLTTLSSVSLVLAMHIGLQQTVS